MGIRKCRKKLKSNETGVSEVIGMMFLMVILTTAAGIIQIHEVPKWNIELEQQQMKIVVDDFMSLQHDISIVPMEQTPITSTIHMGVKYPTRFIFINPAAGESGILTTEPVNITVNNISITSSRIRYKTDGISTQPELVYEYGLVIRDYGEAQITENDQTIVNNNGISIPVVFSQENSINSLDPETLSIFPTDKNSTDISIVNITLDTDYPSLWKDKLAGISGVSVNLTEKKIYINRNVSFLSYPINPMTNGYYSGRITDADPPLNTSNSTVKGDKGDKGDQGINGKDGNSYHTNIDPNKLYYPNIQLVTLDGKTTVVLTAQVYNATIDNIHADLTDISMGTNIWLFDVNPDTYINNIATWNVNNVDVSNKNIASVTIWATNNNMQFYTQRVFQKQGNGNGNWN